MMNRLTGSSGSKIFAIVSGTSADVILTRSVMRATWKLAPCSALGGGGGLAISDLHMAREKHEHDAVDTSIGRDAVREPEEEVGDEHERWGRERCQHRRRVQERRVEGRAWQVVRGLDADAKLLM
jgi:hypothetical protein